MGDIVFVALAAGFSAFCGWLKNYQNAENRKEASLAAFLQLTRILFVVGSSQYEVPLSGTVQAGYVDYPHPSNHHKAAHIASTLVRDGT